MFYYEQNEDAIHHFSLTGLIKEDETISIDYQNGYVSHLGILNNRAHHYSGIQLTGNEIRVLVPLFMNFPYHCPYEILHASYNSGRMDEKLIAMSRITLQDALENGYWNEEFRGVRGTISRVRRKLIVFNLDIGSILQTGYQLQKIGQKISQKVS